MDIQRISNFYIPNVSVAINTKKRTLEIYKNDSDQEMNENDQVDLLLEVGITDFWALNSLYKIWSQQQIQRIWTTVNYWLLSKQISKALMALP